MSEPGSDGPLYPVDRSFVVQLTRDAGQATSLFAGKIEHLSSGWAACFSDLDELTDLIRRMTADSSQGSISKSRRES